MTAAPVRSLWFGSPARPLLGFYHPGVAPCGVVLCYPFFHEYTAVYRAYRHLAERLAAAGFPVLRFDYDGTGDSVGGDDDPDRLGAWVGSIRAAIDQVLQVSEAQTVCLIGLRLGATLAYLAAGEHRSVSSLILWAPSLTGKSYVREWKALRLLKGRPTDPAAADGDEEAAGFRMTRQTLQDLASVDLLTAPLPAATQVLLLARDGLLGEKRLADHLSAHGVAVDYRFLPGYAELVVEPYNVVIPDAVFTEMIQNLAAAHPPAERAGPAAVSPAAVELNAPAAFVLPQGLVHETPGRFGPASALFGILTQPSAQSASPPRPALLLVNTSVIHRVGANRMYVPMARRWAAAGFPVLRMDLFGLGDSGEGRAGRHMYCMEDVQDVRAAMDYLSASQGITSFILVGLCSGAYMVFHGGLEDRRVMAEVMINPQTFEWRDGETLDVDSKLEYKSLRFYLRAAMQKHTWSRLLRGKVHVIGIVRALTERIVKNAAISWREKARSLGRTQLSENRVFAKFRQILERNIHMYVIFSQEDPGLDEFALQLGKDADRLPGFPTFKMEILDGPDHTFTALWSQQRMEELITTYVTSLGPP